MSLRYLVDTNIASHYLRRSSPLVETRMGEGLRGETVTISVLTRAELRFGQAAMASDDKRRRLIDLFSMQLPNLPWTIEAADRYGAIKDSPKRSGTPIGELDTQIAAHALAEGLTLVTHNTRHFEHVVGLGLVDWMTAAPAGASLGRA